MNTIEKYNDKKAGKANTKNIGSGMINTSTTATQQGATTMKKSLEFMIKLIADGSDFDDAVYYTSRVFKESIESLTTAYDNYTRG